MRKKPFLLLSLLWILAAACSKSPEPPLNESALATEVAATILASDRQPTEQSGNSSIHTASATDSVPLVYETPATSIMEPSLAMQGTPLPDLHPISISNVGQIEPLASWGRGLIYRAMFSQDEQRLYLAGSLGIHVLDPESLTLVDDYPMADGCAEVVEMPDGRTLGALQGSEYDCTQIVIWDRAEHVVRHTMESFDSMDSLRYLEVDQALVSFGRTAQWWNLTYGDFKDYIELGDGGLHNRLVSPSGLIVARIEDPWDTGAEQDQERVVLKHVRDGEDFQEVKIKANHLAISGDDQVLAISSYDGVSLYSIPGGELLHTLDADIYADRLRLSSDGRFAILCDENEIWLWEPMSNELLKIFEAQGTISWMTISPQDSALMVIVDQSDLYLLPLPEGTLRQETTLFSNQCLSISSMGTRGQVAAYQKDGEVLIMNGADGTVTARHKFTKTHLAAFSPDLTSVAYWDAWMQQLGLSSMEDGAQLTTLEIETQSDGFLHRAEVVNLTSSVDGSQFGVGTMEGSAGIWDPVHDTYTEIVAASSGDAVIAISPAADLFALGSESGIVRIVTLPAGEQHALLAGQTGGIEQMAFSPDGKLLASASYDGTIVLWDALEGTRLATLDQSEGDYVDFMGERSPPVRGIAFSPDADILASWSSVSGQIWLWDTQQGAWLRTLHFKDSDWSINTLSFSVDGQCIYAALGNGTIKVWGVPVEE